MKEHETQIEGFTRLPVPMYAKKGNLMRAGKVGELSEGFTPELQAKFDQVTSDFLIIGVNLSFSLLRRSSLIPLCVTG